MARSTFVYVTYIRTTPEKLWSALTDDVEFMKQYWFGVHCESEWKAGSSWKMVHPGSHGLAGQATGLDRLSAWSGPVVAPWRSGASQLLNVEVDDRAIDCPPRAVRIGSLRHKTAIGPNDVVPRLAEVAARTQ